MNKTQSLEQQLWEPIPQYDSLKWAEGTIYERPYFVTRDENNVPLYTHPDAELKLTPAKKK